MTGTKTVGVYIGIRVILYFHSNRQGKIVIIILRTEKLQHKNHFYISSCCLHSTLHTIFILHQRDFLYLTACKVLREDPIGCD